MKIVIFSHSLESCWNHGNAHFLRGVTRDLLRRGHRVVAYEPADAWSRHNLVADHGEAGLAAYRTTYPELQTVRYGGPFDAERACDGADLVLVHEWNDPALVAAVGRVRRSSRFTLLFHDTHHRAVSEPDSMARFQLDHYDGVLAFGRTLAETYRKLGWGSRVFVWHEAADVTVFHPPATAQPRAGLVWVGNWGDGERSAELREFLLAPARAANLALDIFGVRYPAEALAMLAAHGANSHGWIANAAAPSIFARHMATVHVPRRFYAEQLPGIPTIRVFEALACGIPLLSAPWHDSEHLFRRGTDYLMAATGEEMRRQMIDVAGDPALRASLAEHGLQTIRARHTCTHRVDELLGIVQTLRAETCLTEPI